MSSPHKIKKCVVYCRVSSKKQVEEGDGLGSQEERCKRYAEQHGYKIAGVFKDPGVSGGLFDRPAMQDLMTFLDSRPAERFVVVFDDLKRFARDYQVHLKLKLELVAKREAVLECLNFNFDDSPEGEFIEGITALASELERKQNRRQVIQKQKARLERGYWPFCPPKAYKSIKSREHGKILVPNEPHAGIVRQALEQYADDILHTQEDVRLFIEQQYASNSIKLPISIHGVQQLLGNSLYAGYIEYNRWDVQRIEGKHEALITKSVFERIQKKIHDRSNPKFVKSHASDFPLRRFVECAACGAKLRASWNRGNGGKYANYWCQEDGCQYKYKVTGADTIHIRFETILADSAVPHDLASLSKAILLDVWDEQETKYLESQIASRKKALVLEKEIAALARRAALASSDVLVQTYEAEIERMTTELKIFSQKRPQIDFSKEQFGTCLNKVYKTLENPLHLWRSPSPRDKQTILTMYFDDGLKYDYFEGFGTAKFSDAIGILTTIGRSDTPLVEMSEKSWNHFVQSVISFR